MKFTVLGMGKTGHTVCAYLLQQGQTVTAWDRDAQKLAVLEQSGIRVSGALEGHFPIHTESSLADAVAEVVELGATDGTVADNLELGDLGAVKREGALDADAEGDLADSEGLAGTLAAHADDVALEDLLTLTVALDDAVVNLDVVARANLGDVLADLLTLDGADVVHSCSLSL